MIDYEVDARGAAVLTWNMQGRPVNVMNDDSLALFAALVERALADPLVKGIVIASAKRDFVTGADLASFLSDRRPHVIFEKGRSTQAMLRRLETGGKPACAALGGSALGGGLEIALACHHRVAADKPSLRLGLPEVTLGLLPGAGGTQRLPRLIGVRAAIPYLVEGRVVTAAQALEAGIVHELVPADEVVRRAADWVASHTGPAVQPWDVRGFTSPGGPLDPVGTYQIFATETARITARTQNNLPAPRHILSSVFEGCGTDLDTGLRAELRHFVSCVCSVESRNIIRTNFFGVTDAAKLKQRPRDVPELACDCLAVAGPSAAVADLIHAAIAASLPVVWFDPFGEPLPTAWAEQVTLAAHPGELDAASFLITSGPQAPPSGMDAHATVWNGPGSVPRAGIGLRLASPTSRLIELVHDDATSPVAIAQAMDLARRLGKVPLLVRAVGGTYVERVQGAYEQAIAGLLAEGVSPVLINSAARQAGMARAPLPATGQETMPMRTTPGDWDALATQAARVKDRLLVAQAEEALRCLDDGVVATALDADIGALLGWGFPMHLGGPIGYVDTVGAARFLRIRQQVNPTQPIETRLGDRLELHAAASTRFHDD